MNDTTTKRLKSISEDVMEAQAKLQDRLMQEAEMRAIDREIWKLLYEVQCALKGKKALDDQLHLFD